MIPFLRKARKRLLAENRLTRYLIYAMGEIVLVVIGILIALQINTWNEERKFKAQQYDLLHDLSQDLQASLNELRFGLAMNRQTLDEYRVLMQAIRQNRPASAAIDSLCLHLENWHSPFFTRTAYESLKNTGLQIITNDSLKEQIISIYERSFMLLTDDYDKMEWDYSSSVKTSLLNKYIQYEEIEGQTEVSAEGAHPMDLRAIGASMRVLPVDFEAMKSDTRFRNMLSQLIHNRVRGVRMYTHTIVDLEDLILAIQQELIALEP